MAKNKTPDYTRRAIEKYNEKFYKVLVRVPIEYQDKIKSIGLSGNAYINDLIKDDLIKRGMIEEDTKTD